MILNEVTYRYIRHSLKEPSPSTLAFAISTTSAPSLIIYSNNGPVFNSDDITIIIVSVRTVNNLIKMLYSTNINIPEDVRNRLLDIRKNVFSMAPSSKDVLLQYPKYFKAIRLIGREKIYHYITTDLKMTLSIFTEYFGEPPKSEQHHDQVQKFHKANLIFTESMRESRKKNLLEMLQTVYQKLNSAGLSYVFSGDIRFVSMTSVAAGLYYPKSKDIRIVPKADNSKEVVGTIIHEFGHKFYYEFMSQEKKTELHNFYVELIKNGSKTLAVDKFKAAESDSDSDIVSKYKVGQTIIYTGKKRKFIGKRLEIIYLTPTMMKARDEYEKNRTFSGAPRDFYMSGWKVEGTKDISLPHKYDTRSNDWFPTKYSLKDFDEWFAENFVFYVLGYMDNIKIKNQFAKFL